MAPKILSSLKWLIDKRARQDAEIRKTWASLTSAKQLIEELSKLEDDLAAIDRSLGLHEIVQVEHIWRTVPGKGGPTGTPEPQANERKVARATPTR